MRDLIVQTSFLVLLERPMILGNSPELRLLKLSTPLPYKHLHSRLSNVYSKRRWEWLSEDGKITQSLKKDLKNFTTKQVKQLLNLQTILLDMVLLRHYQEWQNPWQIRTNLMPYRPSDYSHARKHQENKWKRIQMKWRTLFKETQSFLNKRGRFANKMKN